MTVRIRQEIAEGIDEGESATQIAKRVADFLKVYSISDARRIARTESAAGFNGGRNIAMERVGIDEHEWLSARDADVRDSHAREDGNTVRLGELFPVTHLEYPGADGPAEEVINCRCVAVPVVR
jgi:SPP1 gp7 family putative phage head morphogenesis protein